MEQANETEHMNNKNWVTDRAQEQEEHRYVPGRSSCAGAPSPCRGS